MQYYLRQKRLVEICRRDERSSLLDEEYELARVQNILLELASVGRGLGNLREIFERNLNVGIAQFVGEVHRSMTPWKATFDPKLGRARSFSEFTEALPPAILAIWARTFEVSQARLLAVLHSDAVHNVRKTKGAKAGALEAAAMLMGVDPMTVRRRTRGVARDARFLINKLPRTVSQEVHRR